MVTQEKGGRKRKEVERGGKNRALHHTERLECIIQWKGILANKFSCETLLVQGEVPGFNPLSDFKGRH